MAKFFAKIAPAKLEESMVKPDTWHEAKTMSQDGLSISEIARKLELDRKTVRKLLTQDCPPAYPKKPLLKRPSELAAFKDLIARRFDDGVTNAIKLLRELRARGYVGGITILRDFIRPLRQQRQREAYVRFETLPGDQSQMDWGELMGTDPSGRRHKFYCFAMVLGYSRYLYAEFTLHMDLLTLLRCLIRALESFGGATRTILFDNMKQVCLDRDPETDRLRYNTRFLDFAHYYSFRARLCRPRRPQTKGKIENGVGYIKHNFWLGEQFLGLAQANTDLRVWLDTVANVRVHATTRERPVDRLRQERLQLLPTVPYDASLMVSRGVTKDCLISYFGNQYSVPCQYVRNTVTVRDSGDGRIRIYRAECLIATHECGKRKGERILNPAHTAPLWKQNSTWRYPRTGFTRLGDVLNEVIAPLVTQHELNVYDQVAEEEMKS